MNQVIVEYMQQYFDEVLPMDFYRSVFPAGELAKAGQQETGKYTAIAIELLPKGKGGRQHTRRYTITDDLYKVDELLKSENFIIMSPISYAGRARESKNARFMYGLAIDFDGISKRAQIVDLFHQMKDIDFLPLPTYCVASGLGLHLYYLFEQPIPCFVNITSQLATLKTALTRKIWNRYTTDLYGKVQIESLFQGFRLAGGVSKEGDRTRIFETGNRVTVEYLNQFVEDEYQVKEFAYKSKLTIAQAKEKYPEWYEKRVVQKQPRGTWTTKADLYYWWIRKIKAGAVVGHRYFAVMCLAIYAKKAGIDRQQLEQDAFGLLEYLDCLTVEDTNHFTDADILAALEMYNDNYITFPIDSITELTGIPIEKNKRNGRKQSDHVRLMNFVRDEINGNTDWRNKDGRPSMEDIIKQWRQSHPEGKPKECIQETGISKNTVYKWWKS